MRAPPPRPVLSTDTGTRLHKHPLVVYFLWADNSFKNCCESSELSKEQAVLRLFLLTYAGGRLLKYGFQLAAFSWSWKVLRTRFIQ